MRLSVTVLGNKKIEPGLRLKTIREKLGLRFREVEHASNLIAQRHGRQDFVIGLSRLADIENKGVVPNIHRIYTLCALYRLDFQEVLSWYEVPLDDIWRDAAHLKPPKSHPLQIREPGSRAVSLPIALEPGADFSQTTYLSRAIQEWGRVPLSLLESLNMEDYRYGLVGYEDRRMYPLLQPGALVQIDESRNKIVSGGWSGEFDRPIYFLELRQEYVCCWCSLHEGKLILQPHPSAPAGLEILDFPRDVEVVGQVVGVAMQLEVTPNPQRKSQKKKSHSAVALR